MKTFTEVTWNGYTWKLYGNGYFRIGKRYLHREKWEKLRGPIPKGYVVHHKDHDKTNNRITNLDCMPRGTHASHHAKGREKNPESIEKLKASLAKNVATRAVALQQAWEYRTASDHICRVCKATFTSRGNVAHFCSEKCRSHHKYYSGRWDEDRNCGFCKQVFNVYKYDKRKCCSQKCGSFLREQNKRASA